VASIKAREFLRELEPGVLMVRNRDREPASAVCSPRDWGPVAEFAASQTACRLGASRPSLRPWARCSPRASASGPTTSSSTSWRR